MRVLLVGSGAREEALALALRLSPGLTRLYAAPGHAGLQDLATLWPIPADAVDPLAEAAAAANIDLAVIGPEAPLVAGLADRLRAQGIAVFGPSAAAARLEGSKIFMKDLAARHGIPTAAYARFEASEVEQALAFARSQPLPLVIKADGLAAGKGVIIAETPSQAESAITAMLREGRFGASGQRIVIEEFLPGEELSVFALADGQGGLRLCGAAQDHKRAYDGDRGPNTGGMGAYSPPPLLTPDLEQRILTRILQPLEAGLRAEGCPYQGVLFAGLMISQGEPRLLEINCRFGDPEAQVVLTRLRSDALALFHAVATGGLDQHPPLIWDSRAVLGVVMAAEGYPDQARAGTLIRALPEPSEDATILQAGTRLDEQGRLIAPAGRALTVLGFGHDLASAQRAAYRHLDRVDWPEGFCRRDIGWRALGRVSS